MCHGLKIKTSLYIQKVKSLTREQNQGIKNSGPWTPGGGRLPFERSEWGEKLEAWPWVLKRFWKAPLGWWICVTERDLGAPCLQDPHGERPSPLLKGGHTQVTPTCTNKCCVPQIMRHKYLDQGLVFLPHQLTALLWIAPFLP